MNVKRWELLLAVLAVTAGAFGAPVELVGKGDFSRSRCAARAALLRGRAGRE